MKRNLCLLALLALLGLCAGALAEYSPGCLDQPPQEVLAHTAERWPDYELEDYCEVIGTPEGDYGFALMHKGSERILVGYRREDGKMRYWLKNAGAVPQGKAEAWFSKWKAGWYYEADDSADNGISDEQFYDDGLGFMVTQLDDAGESYAKDVVYHWMDGQFRLTDYKSGTVYTVSIKDGYLEFWNWAVWEKEGTVKGAVQTDIRYVSYASLPKRIDEARRSVTLAPEIHGYDLNAQKVKFAGGKKYPVYTGPGETYARGGNGKGSVSTNDWIEVYGKKDGWVLIQYDLSADHYRFGWIEESALPKGADVPELHFKEARNEQSVLYTAEYAVLTDDPLVSRTPLAKLPPEHKLSYLARLDEKWVYVQVEVDGRTMCGFMLDELVTNG